MEEIFAKKPAYTLKLLVHMYIYVSEKMANKMNYVHVYYSRTCCTHFFNDCAALQHNKSLVMLSLVFSV